MSPKDLFNIPESKVMYNAQGEPEFVLVPIKQSKVYDVSDEEIVSAVGTMREDLWRQYNADPSATAA